MRLRAFGIQLAATTFVVSALIAPPVMAHEDSELEFEIEAPLERIDCNAMTVTVLGLTIDISRAQLESDEDDDDSAKFSGDDAEIECTALSVGGQVEITLTNDQTLVAIEVELEDGDESNGDSDDDSDVEITAPIQSIDLIGHTITLFGLVIDISHAEIEADSDEHAKTSPQLSQLMVGQFVEVELSSALPPFTATELEIQEFANQVAVQLVGPHGEPLTELGLSASEIASLRVDVVQKLLMPTARRSNGRTKLGRKTLRFHTTAEGDFTLVGLPAGLAKISVTPDGLTRIGKGRVRVNVVDSGVVTTVLRLGSK
jgi:hypothetical protein